MIGALLASMTLWSQNRVQVTERPFRVLEPELVYLGSIHYPALSARMGPRSLRQLAMLAADIKEEPGRRVRVVGYSRRGRADLALARAEDVATALKNFGIPMESAIISTVTVSGKKESSRVDILLEKQVEKQAASPVAKSLYPVWLLLFITLFTLVFFIVVFTGRARMRSPWL